MAINDNATLVIGSGNYFTGTMGLAIPTDLTAETYSGWENVGHTSLEDIFGVTSEGGEATTIGTLQNSTLRTKYSARTETFTFTLQQFDAPALKLFYGSNMEVLSGGLLGIPENPTPTQAAFLTVFVDGENIFAFYAPKAEIYRADDLSISDTESLAGLPLGVKPMKHGTNKWTYAVTPLTGIIDPPSGSGTVDGTVGSTV